MFNFKRASIAVAALVVLSFAAPAKAEQNAEALKFAHEIMDITHASALGDQMMTAMMKVLTNSMVASNPGKAKEIDEIINEIVVPEFRKSLPDLMDQSAQTYADNFSVDELKQLLAFYQSDIGKKLIERQPAMLRQQSLIGQVFAQTLMGRVRDKIVKALQEKGLQKPQGI
jgi:hypothetical protein